MFLALSASILTSYMACPLRSMWSKVQLCENSAIDNTRRRVKSYKSKPKFATCISKDKQEK